MEGNFQSLDQELEEVNRALKNSKPVYFLIAFIIFFVWSIVVYRGGIHIWTVVIALITGVKFVLEKMKVYKLTKRKNELKGVLGL